MPFLTCHLPLVVESSQYEVVRRSMTNDKRQMRNSKHPFSNGLEYASLFTKSITKAQEWAAGRLSHAALLFTVGFVSLLGQVALLRELNVAFYGVELMYSLAIGVWMVFTAAGSWMSRRRRSPSPIPTILALSLLSLLLPFEVAFVRGIRVLFAGIPGAYLSFHIQILAMSLSLLPVGLLLGLLFRRAADGFIDSGESLALAYAIESAGGIFGGICATLLLRIGLPNFTIALLCALAGVLPAVWLAGSTGMRLIRFSWVVPVICLAAVFPQSGPLDRWMTSWTHPNLVDTQDTPYSRVTVTRLGNQVSVFENDALSFNTEGTEAEEFVQLAAIQHPRPDRILILGGGIEGLVYEIQKHRPALVDYVELNRAYLETVQPYLPAETGQPLLGPNVRIRTADPRSVLSEPGKYDLILVGMPEPASGQANRFYTREFYRQCLDRLNPHGIVGFRLRSSENYRTPQLTQRTVSIFRAARSVFQDVLVLPGSNDIFICSNEALPRDPEVPAGVLAERGIAARLVSAPYIRYLYRNDRFVQVASLLERGAAPVNSDLRPICYQYTVMMWLSKFFPSIANVEFPGIELRGGHSTVAIFCAIAAAAVLFRLLRRWEALRRAMLMAVAGFLGMLIETLLILHYQVKNGILFQDLGILLMSFMGGLTAGSLAVNRVLHHRPADGKALRTWGFVLVPGFALPAVWIAVRGSLGKSTGLLETSFLLGAAGFLVAGVFARESVVEKAGEGRLIAPLYSADLVGGCVGSLAASLLLVPLAGLAVTCVLSVVVALLAMILV